MSAECRSTVGSAFGLDPSARVSLGAVPKYEPNELERLLTQ
jgi:hypothetical protein